MKVVLIFPSAKVLGGNLQDVTRLKIGFTKMGVEVLLLESFEMPSIEDFGVVGHDEEKMKRYLEIVKEFKKNKVQCLHAFHSYKSRIVMKLSKDLGVPFVVTMTGTDYNEYLEKKNKSIRDKILKVLEKSKAITFLNLKALNTLTGKYPKFTKKCICIRRNLDPFVNQKLAKVGESGHLNIRKKFGIGNDVLLFTLIAGIRGVKNVFFAVNEFASLKEAISKKNHHKPPDIMFLLIGPILDVEYFKKVNVVVNKNKCIIYGGVVKKEDINYVYLQSDIVLNTSISEGGSLVILEAMGLGKPVLVSECEGNVAFVKHKENGIVFSLKKKNDFVEMSKLLFDGSFRKKMVIGGKKRYKELNENQEIEKYLKLY